MILVIDNYDSFTWNLVQRLYELDSGLDVRVVRNDKITADEAEAIAPERVIVSPGPCTPQESGVSRSIIERFAGRVPVLGVCLGHQCIGDLNGMPVVRNPRIVHGKTSPIHHDNQGLFAGLPNPFTATRYHSLVIPIEAVPDDPAWTVSAWTTDTLDGVEHRIVMGLRRNYPDAPALEGMQFHPESFLTDAGPELLANFLLAPQSTRATTPQATTP